MTGKLLLTLLKDLPDFTLEYEVMIDKEGNVQRLGDIKIETVEQLYAPAIGIIVLR